jgi:hypothetical protein
VVPEILNGLLWQARLSIRSPSARAFAAHGYVDPSYRPPRLPFVSVVGPLSLHVEPERENGRVGQARLRVPGHVIGQVRAPGATVPAAGGLRLRFDGRASVTLALAGLPATPFGDPATGPAIALAINTAIVQALAAGLFTDTDGSLLTDPTLLAALQSVAARWSATGRALTISSDPGTVATGMRSSAEVLPTAGDLAPALGLAPPAVASLGRSRLHRLPPPRPMTVEVRLDLWARSQADIALMFDGLAYAAPTRGRLVLRPSLLAADVADGATELRLLDEGEPTAGDSLVHLEGRDGLSDRARDVTYTASAGAASDPAAGRFQLSAEGQIAGPVWVSPVAPDPLFASQPAPGGFAVALGLQLDPAADAGESYALLALERAGVTVLGLALRVVSVAVPGQAARLFGEVTATATLVRNNVGAAAVTVRRIPLALLQAGGTLHATVVAETGTIGLAWDGESQRLEDPLVTPAAPVPAPGVPATGADMTLTLGGGAGAALPRPVSISHVHLVREPYGPLDPRLRVSVSPAARLRPGDMIAVATSADGWQVGDRKSLALVDAVLGDRVLLTRPVSGRFARGGSLVFQDECFFFQTAVKRRDDLMNQLYHCSVDYKVSALLEDPAARATAILVHETHEELTARGASRAPGGHPGVSVVDAGPARGVN